MATALTPSPLCDPLPPCPALPGICEPFPSMVLLALPPRGVGAVYFFFLPGGGRRGRGIIKDSVPEMGMGKGETYEGAEAGKAKVVLSLGGVVWGQALNIILLKNLSGKQVKGGERRSH